MKRKKMYPVRNTPYLQPWEAQLVDRAYREGNEIYVLKARLPSARVRLHEQGNSPVLSIVNSSTYDTLESLYEHIENVIQGEINAHEED